MLNRSSSTSRSLFVMLLMTCIAVVPALSARSAMPGPPDIFGLWLTTDPAGVGFMEVIAASTDKSSVGIEQLRVPFALIFRCSIEDSWSDREYWYYSVVTVTSLHEGLRMNVMHHLLRLSHDGNTLEIAQSSAERVRRSSVAAMDGDDRVVYHRVRPS
jgi:hypothetical protein